MKKDSDERDEGLYVGAEAAAKWLGVSRATLYAYVSRGLIRSESTAGSKVRRYHRADLESLARRGRGAGPRASASALRFGEPLLESAVSLIQDGKLYYRGRDATELARTHRFEEVANLLWSGEATSWTAPAELAALAPAVEEAALPGSTGTAIERAASGLLAVGTRDVGRFGLMREQVARSAGTIVRVVIALMAPADRVRASLEAGTAAEGFWISTSGRSARPNRAEIAAIDGGLILCADHELNPSTFTARVTASTGASLYAVLTAALAALSGPRHGGMSDRIEALFRELDREARTVDEVPAAFAARLGRGEVVSGFGHQLYPAGDPRFVALDELCHGLRVTGARKTALDRVEAAVETGRRLGYGEPTLDFGLVSLRMALGLPSGAATALFAAGRTAGWIAHALEQSGSDQTLRPRARYVGPPPV